MRILHISDLHARATVPADQQEIVTALLSDIGHEERSRHIDLVLFTGDLTQDGSQEAFASARGLLLDPLAQELPGRTILLTPGNHDVSRTSINAVIESGLQQQLVDDEAVQALLDDAPTLTQACARLDNWQAFAREWHDEHAQHALDVLTETYVTTINGFSVGVVLLNSAWRASGGEQDRGRLLVSEQGARRALDAIDSNELRLVVMHHPLSWLAEFDAVPCRTLLESHGVFVFSGHEHSPDPASEMTTRGAALYSRAGCLYAGTRFSNSYTILDLDPSTRDITVSVRRWWPKRKEFDQATDLHREGKLNLPWPTRANALATSGASIGKVLGPLAQIAQEQSLIAGDLALTSSATVSDLLISPTFWPVPNKEAIDATVPKERRPKPINALDALQHARVLIVSGEHSSGVTSSLLWVLEQHFRLRGTALPAYAQADERLSLGRLNHALSNAQGSHVEGQPTPRILAIDDVKLSDRRAKARLLRFLDDNPHVTVIIGCHEDEHAVTTQILEARQIAYETVFLAPFGRREMRELIMRIAGPDSSELVQRVLNVIHGQGLARNPLNVAALIAVVTREEDLTELNESGLLQSYVTILLENPVAVDPEGLAMDYRRREHFLAHFAAKLVEQNRSRLQRLNAEQLVLEYYDGLGWQSASAGQLLDSLIRRRVLSENDDGVGFRYPALLHLFAAKAAIENTDFARMTLEDPIRYADIIRHTAGLKRSDANLLRSVCSRAVELIRSAAPGLDVEQFELITDRDGWSQIDDLNQVRRLVRPPGPPPSEEELDEIWDEMPEMPPTEQPEAFPEVRGEEGLERLAPPIELLASVLKSSELVADIDLKTEVLREVIVGWSRLSILLAVREDETRDLQDILARLFRDEQDDDKRKRAVEHFSRVLVVTVMTFALYAGVGSQHLQAVMDKVFEDEQLLSETANDLFATMLYAMLDLPKWPARLGTLHARHGKHPMVKEVARRWALRRYVEGELEARTQEELEGVLIEMLMPEGVPRSGPARISHTNEIRERLLHARRKKKWVERERLDAGTDDEDASDSGEV